MVDVVASIQNAIDIAGKLRALSKKIEDAEFKMLLADLSGDLADAKLEVANLKIELASTKSENLKLKAALAVRYESKPVLDEGAYTFEGEAGHFCTACLDVGGQRVRVTRLAPPFDDFGRWQCPGCQAILT